MLLCMNDNIIRTNIMNENLYGMQLFLALISSHTQKCMILLHLLIAWMTNKSKKTIRGNLINNNVNNVNDDTSGLNKIY